MKKQMVNGYKALVKGILTHGEYFLYTRGMLKGVALSGVDTDSLIKKLSDLQQQYESIPYKPGRDMTKIEQNILDTLQ